MKLLTVLFATLLGLQAGSLPLTSYLDNVASTNTLKSIHAQIGAEMASQQSQLQSEGFLLNGELDYADIKNSNDSAVEFHVSLQKQILFGGNDDYTDALKISAEKRKELQTNQLKAIVYEHYINACTFQEKAGLLNDAKERNIELTKLIEAGVAGGEFDRSALLRSELVVQQLQLRIRDFNSRYYEALQMLMLYSAQEEEPLCQDLPFDIPMIRDPEQESLLYQSLQSDILTSSALQHFRSATIQEVTIGVGYDNEIDTSRGLVFMQIPLTKGSRRESQREAAIQAKLSAQEKMLFATKRLQSQIRTYKTTQEIRQESFKRLNDILIPKAYETSVLLLERFMGSEGSYLEYINSQTMLFDLLLEGIDTHAKALVSQAKLYQALGIDPQKDMK